MKHISSTLATVGVILALGSTLAIADDDDGNNKKGVPPGLAKKGGVPPGQAKKQGYNQAGNTATNASTPATVQAREPAPAATPAPAPATTPAPTPSSPAVTTPAASPQAAGEDSVKVGREVQARRAKVESQVAEIDSYGNTPEARERIFTRLHRNSNIPVSALEAQRKSFPEVGLGGITVANYISKGNPKVSASQVLAEHKSSGKGWGEIAQQHGVHLTELIDWLAEAKAAAKQADTTGRLKGL